MYKNQRHSLCLFKIVFQVFSTSNKSMETSKQVSPKFKFDF